MLLQGKTALISGASQGIGSAIARTFLEAGASLYYLGRKAGNCYEEYNSIALEKGSTVVFRECDVSDEKACTEVALELLEKSGGIDILINNAGITRDSLFFRMSSEDWKRVLDVNLTGAFYLSKPLAHSMIRRRSGAIINVSSIVGLIGNAGQGNYCAAKAGIIGFTKSLAREVAQRGVRVNAVAPGFIDTPMTENLTDAQREQIIKQIPMGRIGTAEEIANVCLFLASDLASYITGQVISISGGLGM